MVKSYSLADLPDCNLCGFQCHGPVEGITVGDGRLFILADHPSLNDDRSGEPLSLGTLEGGFLEKLLAEANITDYYLTLALKCFAGRDAKKSHYMNCKGWLWSELQSVKPNAVLTLGLEPARMLLRHKKDVLVGCTHVVDYMPAQIIPWHSLGWVLRQPVKMTEETKRIFSLAKEKSNEPTPGHSWSRKLDRASSG